jgi:phosphotransferase system  glucose/maltose/N-acetylglucosamine-specific IIC component
MATLLDVTQTSLDIAIVAVYGFVGWVIARRRVEGPARLANSLFSTWWAILAILTALGIAQRFAAVAGVADLAFYLTMTEIELLLLCVALWALLYYLVYVLTGSRKAMIPITIFYAMYYVWTLFLIFSRHPTGVALSGATTTLVFEREANPLATFAFLVIFLAPVIIAAAGYFRLFFRVHERTQRYRIGLISTTLLVWFGSSAVASSAGFYHLEWWPVISSLLGLLAAFLIYMAYQPPRFVRARWGIHAVTEEASG